MKVVPLFISLLAMLSLGGCGKGNESGRSNPFGSGFGTCVSHSANGQCSQYQSTMPYSSPYAANGIGLVRVQQENPCILGGQWGQMGNLQRSMVQVRVNMPTVVAVNDIFVGVTSYGDVAAIVGNGTNQPLFVAYLCPRPVNGQGTLMPQILIGAYGNCQVKPMTAANMVFPDGTQANFRSPQYGSSAGRPFTFCH